MIYLHVQFGKVLLGMFCSVHVSDRTWFARLFGDNPRALASGLSTVQADELCSISLVA